ncbi:DUF1917-domain-containing protein [Corynespora cassiicola Philippines]|uniref:DUF1917-domain-containing protein n=1 Tax=Corynespora cassiicola Philippines TaxID=1448308 RepID=A0A2T2NH48_CORCC|nr:DUF1917-domain-containing protein [Corynespora cassiicola Philippines]
MTEEALVSGSGWISDDSSFYGDDDNQDGLLAQCRQLDIRRSWNHQARDLNSILQRYRRMPPPEPFNFRDGQPYAWQIGESADDFVKRVPPLTTSAADTDWIWAENPIRASHGKSDSPNLRQFKPRGLQLLEESLQKRSAIQKNSDAKSQATVTRALNQESLDLRQRLDDLAGETHVLSGKWMLFPGPSDVTHVWRLIVDATINDQLGAGAKVAPKKGVSGSRLICIYTRDYRDAEDVLRVLKQLVSMGLVQKERGIYYKSDAYTHLDIYGENAAQYGLQASIYSSQKLLSGGKDPKPTSVWRKQQSKAGDFLRNEGEEVDKGWEF